jgi:hypothetical protein
METRLTFYVLGSFFASTFGTFRPIWKNFRAIRIHHMKIRIEAEMKKTVEKTDVAGTKARLM